MSSGHDQSTASVPADGDADLIRVLAAVQQRGAIGSGPITDAISHARGFVAALPWTAEQADPGGRQRRVVDLGSGGGLPGLVVAMDRPDLEVTLVERRAKRADLLRYAVRTLGLDVRVRVVGDDVRRVMNEEPHRFDVVTARSFGPPDVVLEAAAALVVPGGWLIVSEPPEGASRWAGHLAGWIDLGRLGMVRRLQRF